MSGQQSEHVEPPTPGWLILVLIVLAIAGIIVFWKQIVMILFAIIFLPIVWGALKAFVRL